MKLEEYQDILYEILCVVDDVCRRNHIKYVLHGGTMLGAVRHQGFIPWDDDVDIIVWWKDYDRLCEKLREELPGHMRVIEPADLVPNFYDYTTRVADIRYYLREVNEETLFYNNKQNYASIDILPFAYSADTPLGVSCLALCHKILYGLGMGHRYCIRDQNYTFIQKVQSKILIRVGSKIDMKKIIEWKRKLVTLQDRKKKKYCMSVNSPLGGIGRLFESQWYEEVILVRFRDRKLPIPAGYDGHLTLQYGNYMVPVKDGYRQHLEKEEEK